MRIAGASQYLNAATLANQQGFSASSSSLLDSFSSSNSLLAAGKRIDQSGIGMSASSRAYLDSFLSSTNGAFSALLSVGVEAGIESAETQILGLRASLPESAISEYAFSARTEDSSDVGVNIDEEV